MAADKFPTSYKDPAYDSLDAGTTARLGLPAGLLPAIRTHGERSNADQVSEASAKTPYQIIPATRVAAIKKWGVDPYLSPENASLVAGYLLKDSLDRNNGDVSEAVGEFHGGVDRKNWGPKTDAYIERVSTGMQPAKESAMGADFAKWMAANPAQPAAAGAATPAAAPAAPLDQGFSAWLKGKQAGPDDIPGMNGERVIQPTPPPEPSLGEKAIGTGEAALTTLTGMTGGAAGMVAGTVGGLAGAVLNGDFGTPQGARNIEQAAAQGADALTYTPRTRSGQEQAAAVGDALAQTIPAAAVLPSLTPAVRGAAATRPLAQVTGEAAAAVLKDAAQKASTAVRDTAGQVLGAEPARPAGATPGTMGSVGAAGTDVATMRRVDAQGLPVPIELTKGQAERTFEQQRFEQEIAKDPLKGQQIRDRLADQRQQLLRNFDSWVDETGAQSTDLRGTGDSVQKALAQRAAANKNEVRAAYTRADKSPEAQTPINPSDKVTIGQGDQAVTSSPIDFLNTKPAGLATTALADHARQYAVKLGIADMVDGQLVAKPATIQTMEAWRKEINAATNQADAVQIRDATVLKGLIDAQTEPAAGPLYRQARALRTRFAQNYEDIGLVYDLMNNKRGMSDPKVAAENVFHRSILESTFGEMRQLRRILQTGGDDGKQAWRELQGAAVRWMRDQATRGVARDERGTEVISAAGLDRAVKKLDDSGKLDYLFGKKGGEQVRAINDLAKVMWTSPPGAVNTSNTASVILAALDMATSGVAGFPVPVMSGLRILTTHVKDRQIQRRVNEALGIKPEPKKVKAPRSVLPKAAPTTTRAPESRTVH